MGEEIPPELPQRGGGPDCTHCWDPGKTPLEIYVVFSGVLLCPGESWPGDVNLNQLWVLQRHGYPTYPCQWRYVDANWRIEYVAWLYTFCKVAAMNLNIDLYFEQIIFDQFCKTLFYNETSCDADDFGHDGTGRIT